MVQGPVRHALAQLENDAVLPKKRTREVVLRELAAEPDPFLSAVCKKVLSELAPRERKEADTQMSSSLIEDILELQSVSLFSLSSADISPSWPPC